MGRAVLGASLLCWLLRSEVRLQAQVVPAIQQANVLGQELLLKSGSTGLLLVVVRGKETFVQGFGETSPGSGVTPDRNSVVRLCSLTKIFTTDLLVKLMQDGRVRLDEPLQRLALPGVRVPMLAEARLLTLGDLATHTAGLPREVGPAPRGTPHFTFPSEAFRWAWLPEQRLKSAPGTVALYSNVGFDLLGDALARATHEPYPALLAQRTMEPLGMRETTFTPTPAQCARLLGTAHPEGPCTSTVNSAGSSGLYSTASDLERWLEYLLGTDTPAIPAQNAAAQAVYVQPGQLVRMEGLDHAGQPTGIGLGWIHTALPMEAASADGDILEKTGGGAGFLTYIALNRATHTAIFVAATDGRIETHLNLFKAANNALLTMAGLPAFAPEMPHPAVETTAKPHGRARKTSR
jgi:D-alanyl-D-alanine-carboxypeptidase/D-alanyl-D-alanine-endopeptidase